MSGKTYAAVLTTGLTAAWAVADGVGLELQDVAAIQGVWAMADYQVDGSRSTEAEIRSWVLVVEGNDYNPGVREYSVEYTFRLNPTRTPKSIDLTPRGGPSRSSPIRGIYQVDGDRFVVCYPADPHAERPAGFSARTGSGLIRVTWARRRTRPDGDQP